MINNFTNLNITQVTWHEAQQNLVLVRSTVFIEEQHVAPDFEWDDRDQQAVHLLATINNEAIACLRIIEYRKIGRMAVLKPWRGMGIGRALLIKAINICIAQGSQQISLSAQTHAIGFYSKAGFKTISQEYTDVNIAHVDMQLNVQDNDRFTR